MWHGFCDVLFNQQCNNVFRLMTLVQPSPTPSSKTSAAPSRVKDFPDRKGPTRTIRTMTPEVPVSACTCRTETPMVTKHGIWTWKLSRMRIEKVSLKCKHFLVSQFMTLQTWWIIRFHGFQKSFSEHEQQTPHGGIVKSENMSESILNRIGPLHYQWRNRKLNFWG